MRKAIQLNPVGAKSFKRSETSDGSEMADAVFESVSRYFGLLSDPTRIRILRTVLLDEKSVNDIAAEIGATQTNVSRHLRTLLDGGVIARRKSGNFAFYRSVDSTIEGICHLVLTQMASRSRESSEQRDGALALARGFKTAEKAARKLN